MITAGALVAGAIVVIVLASARRRNPPRLDLTTTGDRQTAWDCAREAIDATGARIVNEDTNEGELLALAGKSYGIECSVHVYFRQQGEVITVTVFAQPTSSRGLDFGASKRLLEAINDGWVAARAKRGMQVEGYYRPSLGQ